MKSYINILIKENIKEVINYILNLNINIYSTKKVKDGLIIKLDYSDYLNIKNKYKNMKIIGKTGRINIIDKYNKYKYELFSVLIFMFFIILLSFNTLYINVDTDTNSLKNKIIKELYKENIKPFTFKKSFNSLNKVKNSIIENNKSKIEWLELKYDGVYLNVKVIERKEKKEKKYIKKETNIIATKNGYIRKLNVTSGEIVKNIGDYVKKGDIIVTGNITRNDEIIKKQRSKGLVYGEVWYIKKINKKVYSYKYKKTNYSYFKLVLEIRNKKYNIIQIKVKGNRNSCKNIFKSKLFNLNIKKTIIYKKLKVKEPINILTNNIKRSTYKNVLSNLNKDEYIISEKVLKKSVYDDKINMNILFKVYEKISKEVIINNNLNKDINNSIKEE